MGGGNILWLRNKRFTDDVDMKSGLRMKMKSAG